MTDIPSVGDRFIWKDIPDEPFYVTDTWNTIKYGTDQATFTTVVAYVYDDDAAHGQIVLEDLLEKAIPVTK